MRVISWFVLLGVIFGCTGPVSTPEAPDRVPDPAPGAAPVALTVDYGSEKQAWMEAMVERFEASEAKTGSGRPIDVQTTSRGSGEAMQAIVAGASAPVVYSPASSAYLALLNDAWLAAGHARPIASGGEPLVLSPVVIAMWKPMAEALGWPGKPIGWSDLLTISADPKGWATLGHPEWGSFKLGHTHPGLSNSGLLAVLAEAYAGAGKTRGLTVADLALPATAELVGKVESSMVHYGKSTSFLWQKMLERGPSYVSASVVYENLVVSASGNGAHDPVVAIYPVEGTFWSDHPYAVLDGPQSGPEERDAAKIFEAFLRAEPQQREALALGFRPAEPSIAVGAPIDLAHGVDPGQPQTLLEVPDGPTLTAVLALWKQHKRSADVVLVLDKSGSMAGEPLAKAKVGASAFLEALSERDMVTVLFFDSTVLDPLPPTALDSAGEAALTARVNGMVASGGTALYDATAAGYALATKRALEDPRAIHAVVVMTDGKDTNSKAYGLEPLLAAIGSTDEATVKVFTIAYGAEADPTILARIAEAGSGSAAKGDTTDIAALFQDMAAFF